MSLLGNKWFKILVFIVVFVFTFILRAHNYDRTPSAFHMDEMLYAWSGLHLVEEGVPVSWSTLDYPVRAEVFKGEISYMGGQPKAGVTLYKPWLDEPPLFSYIIGISAKYFGAKSTDFVSSAFTRFPVILISTLTSVFIFLIAKKLRGYWMGIFTLLLYGTVPLFVISSRVAMPENLIALLLVIAVFLLLKFKEKKSFWYIFPLPFLAGFAGLAKPTGIFIMPLAIFVVAKLLYDKKVNWKKIFIYSGYIFLLTIPFVIFYFWWGLHLDAEIFWKINSIQSSRPIGFNSLTWLMISPSYGTNIFKDSWFVLALVSTVYYIFKSKRDDGWLIILTLVYWFLVIMISGGEGDLLAWYRFPTYPLLSITLAWVIYDMVKKADFFTAFLAFGFLLGNRILLVNPFRENIGSLNYRLASLVSLLPSVVNEILNLKLLTKVTRLIIIITIVIGMYWNIVYIYNAFEIECASRECPITASTKLSQLHLPFIWRFIAIEKP